MTVLDGLRTYEQTAADDTPCDRDGDGDDCDEMSRSAKFTHPRVRGIDFDARERRVRVAHSLARSLVRAMPRGKTGTRAAARGTAVIRPFGHDGYQRIYQATSSIAADINVAQNAGSIIDRGPRGGSIIVCIFGQSGRGQFHGTSGALASR